MAVLKVEVSVVLGIQALLFDEFPQPFNQVEIRRVGRQKTELDLQAGRGGEYHGAFLIAGIVQHQRDRHAEVEVSQLMQQLADTLGGDVGVIGHRNEFGVTIGIRAGRGCIMKMDMWTSKLRPSWQQALWRVVWLLRCSGIH